MKKILFALLTTISGVVLLFSYRTSTEAVLPAVAAGPAGTGASGGSSSGASSGTSSGTPSSSSASGSSSSGSVATGSAASSTTSSGLQDGTFTGTATQTRFGPVQVRITVSGGKITEATTTEYPSSSREDQQINSYAVPTLEQETVTAQGASIDMVSGATYTSRGYLASLQSALDQAKA